MAGINLRPHSKGGKSIAIARRQIEAGAIGICCTTIGEAEVMGGAGIRSILITSPVVTPTMIERLLTLNSQVGDLIVALDDSRNVDAIAAAIGGGKPLAVLVEYDVGQGRTGVAGEDQAAALVRKVVETPQLTYRGVQAYYGHLQHIADFSKRRREADQQMSRIRALLQRLKGVDMAPQEHRHRRWNRNL